MLRSYIFDSGQSMKKMSGSSLYFFYTLKSSAGNKSQNIYLGLLKPDLIKIRGRMAIYYNNHENKTKLRRS